MSISFQPRTKPAVKERKCMERLLRQEAPFPANPACLAPTSPSAKALPPPSLHNTETFPLLSQLSIDSIFISI